jgi:DNA-binding transcriptional LysR family regulator
MANIKDEFEKVYPDNVLDLLYLHPNEIIKQLYDGSLDFGVISFPTLNLSKEQLLEVDIIPWKDEEMVLVAPTDHPLSSIDSVSTKQLNGLDLISFDSNLNIAHTISDFLAQNGVVMRLKQRFDNVEAIKRAVESGEGVAILPAPTLNREVELGILKAIPFVDASIIRPLGIIYKKGQLVNNAMQQFIELLMEI